MKRLTAALATALVMGSAATALAAPDQGPPARPGPAAEAPARPGGDRGPGGWHRPMRPPVDRAEIAMRLATRLSAAETLIGIRADQLDAWRAYTSALLDLFAPPPPPPAGPTAGPERAFAREEQMALRIQERAAKADALLKAIDGLKAKLTPEQMEKLGRIDFRPHPPGPPGWRGHGPMAGPGEGQGPRPWPRGPAFDGPQPPMAAPQDDGPRDMPGGSAGPDGPAPDEGPGGMMAPDTEPDDAPPAP